MNVLSNATSTRPIEAPVLKVALTQVPPYMVLDVNGSAVIKLHTGIEANLLVTLAEVLHFNFQAVLPPDGQWGVKTKNGSWTGMVGMVHRKEVDMAMSFIDFTEVRHTAVDFSSPYLFSDLKIITKKGATVFYRSNIFLRAHNLKMWIIIGVTMISAMLLLSLLCKAIPNKRKSFKPCWFVYSTLVFKATESDVPSTTSTRIFLVSWWMFVIVIMYTFSGLLISSATSAQQIIHIDSMEDLAKTVRKGQFGVLVKESTSISEMFLTSNAAGPLQYISEMIRKRSDWRIQTTSEALQKVDSGKYAYMGETNLEFTAAMENVRIYFSQETIKSSYQGIVLRRNFLHKEALNRCISQIAAAGLFDKWKFRTYYAMFGKEMISGGDTVTSQDGLLLIDLIDLKLVCYFVSVSYALSGIVLLFEWLSKR